MQLVRVLPAAPLARTREASAAPGGAVPAPRANKKVAFALPSALLLTSSSLPEERRMPMWIVVVAAGCELRFSLPSRDGALFGSVVCDGDYGAAFTRAEHMVTSIIGEECQLVSYLTGEVENMSAVQRALTFEHGRQPGSSQGLRASRAAEKAGGWSALWVRGAALRAQTDGTWQRGSTFAAL